MTAKRGVSKLLNRALDRTLARRFVAYLLDWYIGGLVTNLPIAIIAARVMEDQSNLYLVEYPHPFGLLAATLGVICACLYYVLVPLLVWRGQTLGKHVLSLSIQQADGSPVTLTHLLLRQLIGIIVIEGGLVTASSVWHQALSIATGINLVTPLMYLGFVVTLVSGLLALVQPDHRCLHDLIGGTRVVLVARKNLES